MLTYVRNLAQQAYNLAVRAWNSLQSWVVTLLAYARAKASLALANAINFALNLYYSVRNTINWVISLIGNSVANVWQNVIRFVQKTVGPIWDRIQSVIQLVTQRIKDAITAISAPIWRKIQPIIDWVKRIGDSIRNVINWVTTQGLALPGRIADLWSLLHNNIIPNIAKFATETAPQVVDIVSNPFGYIYPYLKQYLLELIIWLVAYGFGTVDEQLPPFPTFNFGGAGGALPNSESLALDTSGLHAPLNSLWISGYRFGPGHWALDLGLSNGDGVYAMHDGVVEIAQYSNVGYGTQITIRGGSWWTRYAHCMQLLVEKDDTVYAGQLIAYGDSTGNSTGPHLHLEISFNGQFIDPVTVLPL